MVCRNISLLVFTTLTAFALSACQNGSSSEGANKTANKTPTDQLAKETRETIFDLFERRTDENVTIAVNKYLWVATLEVLDFLPIQQADPFSGVIIFGYGKAPNARQPYRATVLITDPALDLRALHLALATESGPASENVRTQVQDAILTRARQLRLRDKEL